MRAAACGWASTTSPMTTHADASDALAATNPGTALPRAAQRTRLSRIPNSSAAPRASPMPRVSRPPRPTRSPASRVPPATTRSVPTTSATWTGSSSKVTAIAAESTGETPTNTAVRDGPISPTARVKKIWLMPGAKSPVTKNGHVSAQSRPEKSPFAAASATQPPPATKVVTSDAVSASTGGCNARRIVTASAPNDTAAPTASKTTKIGAAGFEPATSASQTQHSDQAELRPAGETVSAANVV